MEDVRVRARMEDVRSPPLEEVRVRARMEEVRSPTLEEVRSPPLEEVRLRARVRHLRHLLLPFLLPRTDEQVSPPECARIFCQILRNTGTSCAAGQEDSSGFA